MNITWQEIKDIFAGSFEEDMEGRQVYVNIQKSGLYMIACRYLVFLCTDIIHWVVSHIDPETMTLSNTSGTQIATFRTKKYYQMYHFPKLVNHMDALFFTPNVNVNNRDIMKHWVKYPSKFRMTHKQVYKMKLLRKDYQLLVIFTYHLYGQESM